MNHALSPSPIFKATFGPHWKHLSPILQQRYANRSYSQDQVIVKGMLDVHMSRWIKCLSPLLRVCGALLPYDGKDIPVTVSFHSDPNGQALGFNRTFYFPHKKPYQFRSKMVPIQGDEVIEWMKFGLGWLMRLHYDGEKIRLDHKGYIWRIFKKNIPLPLRYILGDAYATETAVSDHEFKMYFEIIHPLFGKVFGYHGTFKILKVSQ